MIRKHLGDFLGKLSQNTTTKYKFCPIPKVSYQCLGKELFCHNFYLKNLCDPRFGKWPIDEPVQVFHSSLQMWNDLIDLDSIVENEGKVTCAKVEGAEDDDKWMHLQSIKLLMDVQLLIYKRYPGEISKYKYPAYKLLLSCIIIPHSRSKEEREVEKCYLLKTKRIQFTKIAIDLLFHTCLVSPLNANELIRESGVTALNSLLDFYVEAFTRISKEKSQLVPDLVEIVTIIVHVLSGISYYEKGRKAIARLNDVNKFCLNWRRCLDLGFLSWKDEKVSLIRTYALEGLANMSQSLVLQTLLFSSGVVWPLLRMMMDYHATVVTDDGISPTEDFDAKSHARLAARCLGMLCGIIGGDLSPQPNDQCFNAMKNILTEQIAELLRNEDSSELLQTLNLNVKTPLRVWDNKMREELGNFVERMDKDHQDHQDLSMILSSCETFQYSNLTNEVNVGGVYIRIFNLFEGNIESIRDIADCSEFARSLVFFLEACLEKGGLLWETKKLNETGKNKGGCNSLHSTTDSAFSMVVTSLLYLIRLDGFIDDLVLETEIVGILLNLIVVSSENEVGSNMLYLF